MFSFKVLTYFSVLSVLQTLVCVNSKIFGKLISINRHIRALPGYKVIKHFFIVSFLACLLCCVVFLLFWHVFIVVIKLVWYQLR